METKATKDKTAFETDSTLAKEVKKEQEVLIKNLKKEELVGILIPTSLKKYYGSHFTFTFNGIEVTMTFDGTVQKFPAPIAAEVQRKVQAFDKSASEQELIYTRL